MLLLTFFSEILNQRAYAGLLNQIWVLPTVIALRVLPDDASQWAKFAVLTVLLSSPSRQSFRPSLYSLGQHHAK